MSTRVLCLNYVPPPGAFSWADGLFHPATTLQDIAQSAQSLAWHAPLKVSLPPGEPVPLAWRILRALWATEYDFDVEHYAIRDDPRCATPTD